MGRLTERARNPIGEWGREAGLGGAEAARVAGIGVPRGWAPLPVREERRERERGPAKAVGGRGAGSRGWRSKKEGASRRREETMKRRNNMKTVAGMAFQMSTPSRPERADHLIRPGR